MMETVYIETTILSFYYEVREEPEMIARRNWTRQWWDEFGKSKFDLVTSQAVIDELDRGRFPGRDDALRLANDLDLLPVVEEIEEIVAVYISQSLMPKDALGDALHLALASFYGCDYLLTWNCKHLANANKYRHMRRINAMLDLVTPNLVTPLELLQGE
ncbi:MAG: type II toxin-antitoxin system VapC family toxin [Sedimentisphaerales bacterium]|jgi:predicted nucleic acid-binding protein